MQTRKLTKQKSLIMIILIIALLLFTLIPLLRTIQGNPTFPQSDTYNHFNALDAGEQNQVFDIFVGQLTSVFTDQFLAIAIPLILGLLSLFLLILILNHLNVETHEYYYTLIIVILTPTFIASFVGLSHYALLLVLSLLVTLLFLKKNYFYLLALALLYLVDPFMGILAGLLLLFSELKNKSRRGSLFVIFALIGTHIIGVLAGLPIHYFTADIFQFSVKNLFTFFGARYGYSLFLIILGLFGFYKELSKRVDPIKFLFVALFVLSLFYTPLRILGIVFLSFYAAKAFDYLILRRWKVIFLGQLVLILFFCILLFSTMTYLKEDLQKQPLREDVRSLHDLASFHKNYNLPSTTKILSRSDANAYIQYYSKLPVLEIQLDKELQYNTTSHYAYLHSRDYNFIQEQFQEHQIAFVFVDTYMLSGKTWNGPNEGLLFIMGNNDNFLKLRIKNKNIIYFYNAWNETS